MNHEDLFARNEHVEVFWQMENSNKEWWGGRIREKRRVGHDIQFQVFFDDEESWDWVDANRVRKKK